MPLDARGARHVDAPGDLYRGAPLVDVGFTHTLFRRRPDKQRVTRRLVEVAVDNQLVDALRAAVVVRPPMDDPCSLIPHELTRQVTIRALPAEAAHPTSAGLLFAQQL
jgi:hypothetical protein